MLYMLAEERLGRSSTVMTSNRPPDDWYATFPDPVVGGAILDRLVSSAIKMLTTAARSYRSDAERAVLNAPPLPVGYAVACAGSGSGRIASASGSASSRRCGYVEHGVYRRGGKAASPVLPGFAAVVAEVFDAPETGAWRPNPLAFRLAFSQPAERRHAGGGVRG